MRSEETETHTYTYYERVSESGCLSLLVQYCILIESEHLTILIIYGSFFVSITAITVEYIQRVWNAQIRQIRLALPHHTVHMCNCESSLRAKGIARFYPFIFFFAIRSYVSNSLRNLSAVIAFTLRRSPPIPTVFRRKQNGSDLSQYRYEFLSPSGTNDREEKSSAIVNAAHIIHLLLFHVVCYSVLESNNFQPLRLAADLAGKVICKR